jgi:alpha-1,3-rhamnosyl/mannosyltransferase
MLALDALLLPFEIGWRDADVYHSVQLSLPLARRSRAVITVHDLAPLHWPRQYLRLPHARIGHLWQYALAQRADAVIAPSHATARDLMDRLHIPSRRIHVIPEAVDLTFAPPERADAQRAVCDRFGVPSRYVLYVGQFDPRKNMEGLLRAFAAAAAGDNDLRLVIAGDLGKLARHLYDALADVSAPRERVIVTGWVDDATLDGLYRAASCFVFPSLAEGFGLPVLEAMLRGAPVACSNATSLPEVGGDAALYFDPTDTDAITDAMLRLLTDAPLRRRLSERGRRRAERFSWRATAEATLRSYERALS